LIKGKNKKVKIALSPTPSKAPKAEFFPDSNTLHPAWRIALLEMGDPYGWHELNKSKLNDIRKRLSALEKLTWNEILVVQKHWNHTIQRGSLTKKVQYRLVQLNLDDLDELVSLRLSSKERIWGFRIDGAMTLLWWDPLHDVWGDGT
jgi:hypothetical protein